ncbi:hypothetical protein DITRI_Ditri03aG0010700 [Diplodiscus trichospermus]
MDGCRGLNCSTPRRIAARFLSGLWRGKVKRMILGDRNRVDDDVAPSHVTDRPDSPPGCCLLHLIAESKNELQKIKELRIQMESVLQNVKQELVVKKIESNDAVEEGLGFNNNPISNEVLFDQSLKREDSLEGMDRIEAELEVELERLQLHLDTGKLPTNPAPETIKESTVNTPTSARSYSISCGGEVIDPTIDGQEEERWDSHSGVHPYELERKLHELLQKRQAQKIRELEAALRRAKQELSEKEREISWWKDTAHLMSSHVNEPSRLKFSSWSTYSSLREY